MAKIVTFGEVMLRLATPGHLRFGQTNVYESTFGGGEANVAVSLANYGMDADFVTRLPENDIADACLRELRGLGVGVAHCVRGGERMGIYFLETGAVSRASKVIYDRAHSAISEIEKGMIDWEGVLKGADWFHWTGITPAISQGAADVCLEALEVASKLGVTVSCDLNFRKKLWKYGKCAGKVMEKLVSYCDVIIGNEEDAEKVFGIKPENFNVEDGVIENARFESVARQLMEKFPKAKKVVITLRGSVNADHNTWSSVLFDGEKLYSSRTYDITDIVDRVGGGDSFASGLIYGLMTTGDAELAVNYGAAHGALAMTTPGDTTMANKKEVEAIMGGAGARVQR